MSHVSVAPMVILSLILTGLVALTIAGVVLLSLFNRGRYPSNSSHHPSRNMSPSWMSSSSSDSEARSAITIQISPSCPVFFGDAEKKGGVQVMVTPPTPAKTEAAVSS
ncbi:hypothetical protein H2248_009762 [Termitomyces sp. 'cryptogamus']|nr:hypothetical protein H2248_009762 [Termitomyces sp. 'cryptogamus']